MRETGRELAEANAKLPVILQAIISLEKDEELPKNIEVVWRSRYWKSKISEVCNPKKDIIMRWIDGHVVRCRTFYFGFLTKMYTWTKNKWRNTSNPLVRIRSVIVNGKKQYFFGMTSNIFGVCHIIFRKIFVYLNMSNSGFFSYGR